MAYVLAKPKSCVVCGQALSVHRQAVGETCDQASCQRLQLRWALKSRSERERRWSQHVDQWRREMVSPARDEPAEAWPVAILPVNQRPVTNRPEKRTRRFRSHLLRVISQAAEQRYSGASRETEEPGSQFTEVVRDASQLPVLGNACGTCRGHCCEQGGETAFLHVETIRRYMDQHPDRRPREIADDYLSYLQPRTYDGSCVYHGRYGCHLPREMRARICNVYLCPGLRDFHQRVDENAKNQGLAVATTQDRLVRASVLLPNDQFQEIPDLDVPDPPSERAEIRRSVF